MKRVIGRNRVRGFPLDEQCREAQIIKDADGPGDPRRYCSGARYEVGGGLKPGCRECKAYIENVTPWPGERNGVLPGQISVEEYMATLDNGPRKG